MSAEEQATLRREARAQQQEGFARVELEYAAKIEALGEHDEAERVRARAQSHHERADWIRRGMA